MIKYNPKLWFRHIFKVYKSDTFKILLPELIVVALYTLGINILLNQYFPEYNLKLFKNAYSVHTLVGFVMGLLLVFRTNTAYDRWWEGRKQWGALVNNARYAAIKVHHIIPDGTKNKEVIIDLISKFPAALRDHLRDVKAYESLNLKNEPINIKEFEHLPNGMISSMQLIVHEWKKENVISDIDRLLLDKEIKSFIDILGACERIKNTPIPFSYTLFIKKFIFVYILSLPFGFIPDFGYWTILVTTFVFYVFVSIELIAEEIEDPFGTDDNDLPTDNLAEKIAGNIKEISA